MTDDQLRARVDQQAHAAYDAFREFHVKLTDLLPDKLRIKLSQALVQARILPEGWEGSSNDLVSAVSRKIKHYPDVYHQFVIVLEEHDNGYFGCLIHEMKTACPPPFRARFPEAPPSSLPSGSRVGHGRRLRMEPFGYPHELATLAAPQEIPGFGGQTEREMLYNMYTARLQHQRSEVAPTQFTHSPRNWSQRSTRETEHERMQFRIDELEMAVQLLQMELSKEQKSHNDHLWVHRAKLVEERESQLLEENASLKIRLSEAENSHKEKVQELEKDRKLLRQTSQEMHEEIDKKNKEMLETIEKLKSGFDHQLGDEQQHCRELEENCKRLALSKEEELRQLKWQHEEKIARLNKDWQQRVDEQDARARRLEEECTCLNSHASEMDQNLAEKEEQLKVFAQERKEEKMKLEDERKTMRQTSEEMHNDIQRHKQQLQEMQEEAESLKQRHDQVQQKLDDRNHSYRELEQKCQQLEFIKEEYTHSLAALHLKEEELQRQAGEVNRFKEAYYETLANTKKLTLDKDAEVEYIRQKYEEKCKQHEIATAGSQRKEHYERKWKESIDEKQKFMEYLKIEREQAGVNIKERDHEISELKATVDMQRKELEAKEKDLNESRNALLQKELAENDFADEKNEMEKENEALKKEVTWLKEELESVQTSTPKPSPDRFQSPRQETRRLSSPLFLRTPPPIPEQEERDYTDHPSNASHRSDPFQLPPKVPPFPPDDPKIPPVMSLPVLPTETSSPPGCWSEANGQSHSFRKGDIFPPSLKASSKRSASFDAGHSFQRQDSVSNCPLCGKAKTDFDSNVMFALHCSDCGEIGSC